MRFRGHVGQGCPTVGSGNRVPALAEFDIGPCRFEDFRGDVLAGLGEVVGGQHHRRAAADQRARVERAAAGRDRVGVAGHHPYLADNGAQRGARELAVDGLVTLALRGGPDADRHAAIGVQPDRRLFRAGAGGLFDRVADTHAAHTPGAEGCGAARIVAFEIRAACRDVHRARECAAVIDPSEAGVVGHPGLADQVAPAQFHAVFPHRPGGLVQQPLDDSGRFRAARAAIGRGGVGVGMDARGFQIEHRNPVDAG